MGMKILLSWLKTYIDISLTTEEIVQTLTMLGIEVDNVEYIEPLFDGVISAKVVKKEAHPSAHSLCIAEVFDGNSTIKVVCGAPNCREGLITAFAPVGATLYPEGPTKDKLVITSREVRGVISNGMLCSEKELGIIDEHAGIIEFASDMKVGLLLDEYFRDVVFDVSFTPNLGYCMSIYGIAKELAAALNLPLKPIQKQALPNLVDESFENPKVTLFFSEGCPRYSALSIDNIVIAPSSFEVRYRLEKCGIRCQNNVVDATNYVMYLIGQPMHAFDRDAIFENQISIRKSLKGEVVTLLDDVRKELPEDLVLISDTRDPLAVGGIMGCKESRVKETTSKIVLESAYFDPKVIRKASKALGVSSESSKRFERGTDPNNTVFGLQLALELLSAKNSTFKIVGFSDTVKGAFDDKSISLRLSRIAKILGEEYSIAEVESILKRLGFQVQWDGQDTFTVKVPFARHDITQEIDLISEVVRIHGYAQNASSIPMYSGSLLADSQVFTLSQFVRKKLTSVGLQEFLTCDLISPELAKIVADHPISDDAIVKVLHPMSQDQSVLRPSLLPGLLQVVQKNVCQRNFDIRGFEVGSVFLKDKQEFSEEIVCGIVLSGNKMPVHFSEAASESDFFDAKAIVEDLFSSLGISKLELVPSNVAIFHPGRQAKVYTDGMHIGTIGELHPAILRQFAIRNRVLYAECGLKSLLTHKIGQFRFQKLAQTPSSERDWTATLSKKLSFASIEKVLSEIDSGILESFELKGIYENEKLGKDVHNVTLRFVFRNKNKTLQQPEVDAEFDRIVRLCMQNFGSN